MSVEVRAVTDPACAWSWASEPKLRRLMWEFGDRLDWRWVMGGMVREVGPGQRARYGRVWPNVAVESGMPFDPRLWAEGGIESSYPPCQAVVAASEQGARAGELMLRRIREGLMFGRRRLDRISELIALARELEGEGIDPARFEVDLRSDEVLEDFADGLEEARRIPEQAIAEDATGCTGPIERVTFPSLTFVGADGTRRGVYGWQPYELYAEAAAAAGAGDPGPPAPDALAVIDRFGPAATREVEEVTRRPRPEVEAELWRLACEGVLEPVTAMTGNLWKRV
ncbi:MAG: DsbA family protein [Solirubrobacterales bacterium]|nr:DsbA family protein [Solirubrobacterales bacterium]